MKKFLFTLVIALIASVNVMGMTKSRSRQEAYFLTDKMAYELHLTPNQVQDVYEICYDYFRSLGSVYGSYQHQYDIWYSELSYVLSSWQWRQFNRLEYFLNPVSVVNKGWYLNVYTRYSKGIHYHDMPMGWKTYAGGHFNSGYYQTRSEMHRREVMTHTGIHSVDRPNATIHVGNANRPQQGNVQHQNNVKPQQNNNVRPQQQAKPQQNNGNRTNVNRGQRANNGTRNVTTTERTKVSDSTQKRASRSDLHNQRTVKVK